MIDGGIGMYSVRTVTKVVKPHKRSEMLFAKEIPNTPERLELTVPAGLGATTLTKFQ
jgi:hypothetical protein